MLSDKSCLQLIDLRKKQSLMFKEKIKIDQQLLDEDDGFLHQLALAADAVIANESPVNKKALGDLSFKVIKMEERYDELMRELANIQSTISKMHQKTHSICWGVGHKLGSKKKLKISECPVGDMKCILRQAELRRRSKSRIPSPPIQSSSGRPIGGVARDENHRLTHVKSSSLLRGKKAN
jgi:hypothetical protein